MTKSNKLQSWNFADLLPTKMKSRNILLIIALFGLFAQTQSADVEYNLKEHSPPGTLIGNIATSIDLTNLVAFENLPKMKYSFLNIEASLRKLFALDTSTGDLKLSNTANVDREVLCRFAPTCILELQVAIQSRVSQFFRKVFVNVDIVDINDHAPSFRQNLTKLYISESVQIPSSFPLPNAVDEDTGGNNSLQGYSLFPNNTPFRLQYSDSSSNLRLVVERELDHEAESSYTLTIVALDGGDPPREGILKVEVEVEDVNDNEPVFTEDNYEMTVDETVSPGSVLLEVKAEDGDSPKHGQVMYSLPIQAPKIMQMFSIDQNTGELRLIGDFQVIL